MPGMPGSLGRWRGPLPITTNRADMASPRLVRIVQRERVGSHSTAVTSVDRQAFSERPKWSAMRLQWARISGAWVYFSVGT